MATNEYEEVEKPKRRAWIQIIFLILLVIAIGALISATLTIKNYAEMLKNPMGYNMDKFDLAYCTCYDTSLRTVPIQSKLFNDSFNQFIPVQEYKEVEPTIINWSLIK